MGWSEPRPAGEDRHALTLTLRRSATKSAPTNCCPDVLRPRQLRTTNFT